MVFAVLLTMWILSKWPWVYLFLNTALICWALYTLRKLMLCQIASCFCRVWAIQQLWGFPWSMFDEYRIWIVVLSGYFWVQKWHSCLVVTSAISSLTLHVQPPKQQHPPYSITTHDIPHDTALHDSTAHPLTPNALHAFLESLSLSNTFRALYIVPWDLL